MNQDFRDGARAMFDALTMRAANNYHGRKETNEILQKENALIWSWAMEALSEVSEEDYEEMLKFYPHYEV